MLLFRSFFSRKCLLFSVLCLASVISKAAVIMYGPGGVGDEAAFNTVNLGEYVTGFNAADPDVGGGYPNNTQDHFLHGSSTFQFTMSQVNGSSSDAFVVSTVRRALSTDNSFPASLRIDFTGSPNPITAVGADFYLTDIGEARVAGNVTISLKLVGVGTPVTFGPFSSSTTVDAVADFRGFTSDTAIEWIDITPDSGGSGGHYATIDDLSVGSITPVPEPSQTGAIAAFFLVAFSVTQLWRRRVCAKVRAMAA